MYLSWLLMWFETCSGLKVNLEKSEFIPVGRVNDIEDLALELGCKVVIHSSTTTLPAATDITLSKMLHLCDPICSSACPHSLQSLFHMLEF